MMRKFFGKRDEPNTDQAAAAPSQPPTAPPMAEAAVVIPAHLQAPGVVQSVQREDRGVLVKCERGLIRITLIAPDCVQVRFRPSGEFPPPISYAVVRYEWEAVKFALDESAEGYQMNAGTLSVHIARADAKLSFYDDQNRLCAADALPMLWEKTTPERDEKAEVRVTRRLDSTELPMGLAGQPVGLSLRGGRYPLWNTDPVGTARGKVPSYFSIPFCISARKGNLVGGFFWDTARRGLADIGASNPNHTIFSAEGGELRYYQFVSNSVDSILSRYTELTGRMPLPPLWALGLHLSRWSYVPEAKVREIAQAMRDRNLPCDVLYLDIDYMNGFRCFTWDRDKFPNPGGLIGALNRQGYKTVAILDPGIKVDPAYEAYQSGLAADIFLKGADGMPHVAPVWAGDSVFPDFANPKAREWWASHAHDSLLKLGVAGLWNDMNEPVVFISTRPDADKTLPDEVSGIEGEHPKWHNLYGTQMAQASHEALTRYLPNKRPFNITRAAHAGAQRYASGWTGDNRSDWDHLGLAISMSLNSSLSGMPFTGPDVGGFFDDCSPELFARWIQLGAMMPFFRVHSAMDTRNQEPYAFGEAVEEIARKYIHLRYQLLPYLYSAFAAAAQQGSPILRPLFTADPNDEQLRKVEDAFFVGESLLCAPVIAEGATSRSIYLPRGRWYDFYTGATFVGGRQHNISAPLDVMPLFVRAGHVIPLYLVMQYVGQTIPTELRLKVFNGDADTTIYEDAGEGLDYQQGLYRWSYFTCKRTSDGSLNISWRRAGKYTPNYQKVRCEVLGFDHDPEAVQIDNRVAPLWYYERRVIEFSATKPFDSVKIVAKATPPDATLMRSPLKG
jgi:alpha-glucosidase